METMKSKDPGADKLPKRRALLSGGTKGLASATLEATGHQGDVVIEATPEKPKRKSALKRAGEKVGEKVQAMKTALAGKPKRPVPRARSAELYGKPVREPSRENVRLVARLASGAFDFAMRIPVAPAPSGPGMDVTTERNGNKLSRQALRHLSRTDSPGSFKGGLRSTPNKHAWRAARARKVFARSEMGRKLGLG